MIKLATAALLIVFSIASQAAVKKLDTLYKLEVQTVPNSADFLTLKKVSDGKGPLYFVSYRRGLNQMRSMLISQNHFLKWQKEFQPYLKQGEKQ